MCLCLNGFRALTRKAHNMSKQKIIITWEHPPIPDRGFDWRASYAGHEEDGKDGFGNTVMNALEELLWNNGLEDADDLTDGPFAPQE